MNEAALRRLDVSLLTLFEAVLRHRNLTAAARQLGLTQSAVSHGLARLRDIFGDDLFLRRPHGVEPTARAIDLQPTIHTILELAREAIAGNAPFDPTTARATVRIAAQDYHCAILTSRFIVACERLAPGLSARFLPLARDAALTALANSDADIAIGFMPRADDPFRSETLAEQNYAVVARRDHPRLGEIATLDGYCAERHLLVSYSGDTQGVVDQVLSARGRSREIAATVPYFLAALATVAESNVISTLPTILAKTYAGKFELAVIDPPLAIRPLRIHAVRHRRDSKSGLIDWSVDQLRLALAEVT